jgi:hypothetical protein
MKIREGGIERSVTAAEAFLLKLTNRALEAICRGPCILGCDRASHATSRRKPASSLRHYQLYLGFRKRHIRARTKANGPETRFLPRDCTDGPRTAACRGRVGPSFPTESPRKTASDFLSREERTNEAISKRRMLVRAQVTFPSPVSDGVGTGRPETATAADKHPVSENKDATVATLDTVEHLDVNGDGDRAEVFGTTLAGNRSLRFRATLNRLGDI